MQLLILHAYQCLGVTLRETKETVRGLEKKSKLLSEAAERGSGGGGSRTGREVPGGSCPSHPRNSPLSHHPQVCALQTFLSSYEAQERGTRPSLHVQTVLNRGETDPKLPIGIFGGEHYFQQNLSKTRTCCLFPRSRERSEQCWAGNGNRGALG